MEQFIDFAFRHWYLFLALFVIIGLLIGNELMSKLRGVVAVNPTRALQLINDDAVIIDLRDGAEFKSGHISNARHITHGELKDRLKELNKFKSKPILLYCKTGNRAGASGAFLKKQGFASVNTLSGGLNAWLNANLPVSKKN